MLRRCVRSLSTRPSFRVELPPVTDDMAGSRLDTFLYRATDGAPKALIQKLLRQKEGVLHVHTINYHLIE